MVNKVHFLGDSMLGPFTTLLQGMFHEAEQEVAERHELTLLGQQIRDAGSSVRAAQNAVAIAMAQNQQEIKRLERVVSAIADLETRTIAAIEKQEDALAHDAAEAIAVLEDERNALTRAQETFKAELERLTANVRDAQARLRDLQRGQRIAVARDHVRQIGLTAVTAGGSTLGEAEMTLARIQSRQDQINLTEHALSSLTAKDAPAAIVKRLASAGCGPAVGSSAEVILERLRKTASVPEGQSLIQSKS